MIDHLGIPTTDFAKSRDFYRRALAAIGFELLMEVSAAQTGTTDQAGFGLAPKPELWIVSGSQTAPTPVHVAFRVESRAQVDAFYAAAMAAGGLDNGPPGIRAHYHPHYYGAFVRDPDGHNIEAVCHAPA